MKDKCVQKSYEWQSWEKLVSKTELKCHPCVVLEVWPSPSAQLWSKGPTCKGTMSCWQELNYVSRYKPVSATNIGGAIVQSRLLVAQVKQAWSHPWVWNLKESKADLPWPMSNLLTPAGLIKSSCYVMNIGGAPDMLTEPMPGFVGAYITTDWGIRQVLPEETGQGLGIPKEWKVEPYDMTKGLLDQITSLFHWEYLSYTLSQLAHLAPQPRSIPDQLTWEQLCNVTRPVASEQAPFAWKSPDLCQGGIGTLHELLISERQLRLSLTPPV
jgi:hypothetical protein